jgi:hypothetical protein
MRTLELNSLVCFRYQNHAVVIKAFRQADKKSSNTMKVSYSPCGCRTSGLHSTNATIKYTNSALAYLWVDTRVLGLLGVIDFVRGSTEGWYGKDREMIFTRQTLMIRLATK